MSSLPTQYTRDADNSAEIVCGRSGRDGAEPKQTIFQFALNILLLRNGREKMVLGQRDIAESAQANAGGKCF